MNSPKTEPQKPQHLLITGAAVGLDSLEGLTFIPDQPYTACLICGEVYQTDADRALAPTDLPALHIKAKERRDLWALYHSKTHSDKTHKMLRVSGTCMTPEAAHKLAAFGLISVIDMVMAEEVEQALLEAPAVPAKDAVDK